MPGTGTRIAPSTLTRHPGLPGVGNARRQQGFRQPRCGRCARPADDSFAPLEAPHLSTTNPQRMWADRTTSDGRQGDVVLRCPLTEQTAEASMAAGQAADTENAGATVDDWFDWALRSHRHGPDCRVGCRRTGDAATARRAGAGASQPPDPGWTGAITGSGSRVRCCAGGVYRWARCLFG